VGGINASLNSWPATVFIKQNYKGFISQYSIYDTIVSGYRPCTGTIIDDYTIISLASCIQTTFTINDQGTIYTVYGVSSFYPTLESMFDIYAGVNDISTLSTSANVVKLSVAKVIRVIFIQENWF
jgi:hypothetical protein